jgi:ABC-type branched-subunit amino acid transport system ATPase component
VSALAAREDAAGGLLEAVDVTKNFGGVWALQGVTVRVAEGSILGVIGPNGSGKTTLLNCLSGTFGPTSGTIHLDGRDLTGQPGHLVARTGVVRTFQNIRLFGRLTCLQNVEVSALAAGKVRRGRSRQHARELLAELGLSELEGRYATTLSYGDQRRLEVARALAARPRFLLLDEPAAGMNDAESDKLRNELAHIRDSRGCGVMVVEHDLRLIMRLCDRIYVLNEGSVISEGAPHEVRSDPAVVAAYIGKTEQVERKESQ